MSIPGSMDNWDFSASTQAWKSEAWAADPPAKKKEKARAASSMASNDAADPQPNAKPKRKCRPVRAAQTKAAQKKYVESDSDTDADSSG